MEARSVGRKDETQGTGKGRARVLCAKKTRDVKLGRVQRVVRS